MGGQFRMLKQNSLIYLIGLLVLALASVRIPLLAYQNSGAFSLAVFSLDHPLNQPSDVCTSAPEEERIRVQKALSSLLPVAHRLPSARILALLGRAYCWDGQQAKAVAVWQKALALDPHRDDVAFYLAAVGFAYGYPVDLPHPERVAHMATIWGDEVKSRQKDPTPWYQMAFQFQATAETAARLAQMYVQHKEEDRAREVWQQAATRIPDTHPDHWQSLAELALLEKDNERAAQYFAKAAALATGNRAYTLYLRSGDLWQRARAWEKAAQAYSDALRLNPQRLDAYLRLGHLYRQQKEYEKALHWYQLGERIAPYSYAPVYYQALTYRDMGRYEEALLYLDKAFAVNPKASWVLYVKATILARMDRRPEAVSVLARAIELHSNPPPEWQDLKARWERYPTQRLDPDYWFQRGRFQEKKRLWRTAADFYHYGAQVAHPPDDYPLLLREALMWRYLKQFDRAASIYQDLIERYPDRWEAYMGMGEVYRSQGKYDEAYRWFYEAHLRAPDQPTPLYYMGLARFSGKNYGDALKYFEQAIALNPNNAWYWYYKAVTLKALKRDDEAIETLKKAISLHSSPPASWNHTLQKWQHPQ